MAFARRRTRRRREGRRATGPRFHHAVNGAVVLAGHVIWRIVERVKRATDRDSALEALQTEGSPLAWEPDVATYETRLKFARAMGVTIADAGAVSAAATTTYGG